jgi:alpha-ketoglutarate-dependent taurine dioxygenase
VGQAEELIHSGAGRPVLEYRTGLMRKRAGLQLFAHQLAPKYRYAHHWTEGDVLMWDNIGTLHYAHPDYGRDEHRLIKRCQMMADRVFDPAFSSRATAA